MAVSGGRRTLCGPLRLRNPVGSFATTVSKKEVLTKTIGQDRPRRRDAALRASETSQVDGPVQQQRQEHVFPSTANKLQGLRRVQP